MLIPHRLLNLRTPDRTTLVFIALITSALWVFFEVADEVIDGESRDVDEKLMILLRETGNLADPIGPIWLEEAARDITALGSFAVLFLVTTVTVVFLLMQKKIRMAILAFSAVASGAVLSSVLKFGFGRPRPELVSHQARVLSESFPSGHAMVSAVTYLTLGALIAQAEQPRLIKIYFMSLAVLLSFVIGITRIYLGVHWPSDVLAGWAMGSAWALLWWIVIERLQGRGRLSRDESPRNF